MAPRPPTVDLFQMLYDELKEIRTDVAGIKATQATILARLDAGAERMTRHSESLRNPALIPTRKIENPEPKPEPKADPSKAPHWIVPLLIGTAAGGLGSNLVSWLAVAILTPAPTMPPGPSPAPVVHPSGLPAGKP